MKLFNFYTDAGHGWLEVPKSMLVELGIAEQVSGYSYQQGENAYLEEDCDAGLFIEALKETGVTPEFLTKHTNGDSFVRYYPRYRA